MRHRSTGAPSRIQRAAIPALLLALASGAAACISIRTGRALPVERIRPGASTKLEVVDALGAPDILRVRGEDQILGYRVAEGTGSGGGLGLSRLGLFVVEHVQIGQDTLNVVIGPDKKVRFIYFNTQSDKTHTRFWPFGD